MNNKTNHTELEAHGDAWIGTIKDARRKLAACLRLKYQGVSFSVRTTPTSNRTIYISWVNGPNYSDVTGFVRSFVLLLEAGSLVEYCYNQTVSK